MVDTAFINFAFPSTGLGAVNRTMPARLSDIFNIRDFGATGNGTTNDSPFIQKTIDAAITNNGGIIFFPPGGYLIGARLTVPGTSDCGLIFQGCGGSPQEGGGTILSATMADYILYIGHGTNTPVKSIQGIGFKNSQTGSSPTSTEPTPAGNGQGAIYIGSGDCVSVLNSLIEINIGVGIFAAAKNVYVSSCTIKGGYGGPGFGNNGSLSDGGQCYGIIFNSGFFGNCKIQNCGHGVVILGGPATCENIDNELAGYGWRIGSIPITWWNNTISTPALQAAGGFSTFSPTLKNVLGESFTICLFRIDNTSCGSFLGINCQALSQNGYAVCGFLLNNVTNSLFSGCSFSGAYQVAGFDMSGGGTGIIAGNTMEHVFGSNNAPFAGQPIFLNRTVYGAGDNPNIFLGTWDTIAAGSLTLAQLPPSPTRINTIPIMCSNCDFPLWTGTLSNAGKPITAAGPANVLVPARWNGSAWVASA
jgi:hypothetical protein